MKISSKKGKWWFKRDNILIICCPKCGYKNHLIIVKKFSIGSSFYTLNQIKGEFYILIGENKDTLYPIFVCKKVKCTFEGNIILG